MTADTEPADRANFGITFVAHDVPAGTAPVLPDGTRGITSGAALATAVQYAAAVDANHRVLPGVEVVSQYGILSNSEIARMTPAGQVPVFQNVPSWIVTFTGDGVNIASAGPVGSEVRVHHEESIVVNARTGQLMFSYS